MCIRDNISTEVHTENGDTIVVTATRPGEFVVCNLASLSLGNLPVEDEAYICLLYTSHQST